MTSPATRAKKDGELREKHADRWRGRIEGFVIGILAGLVLLIFGPALVAMLPGPKVTASIQGMRAVAGDAAGCSYYDFDFLTTQPIDSMNLKMQFPRKIKDYKFAHPSESIAANGGRLIMQAFEVGRNSMGECQVIQQASNWGNVDASAEGNVLVISQERMPAGTWIMGMVAVSQTESAGHPLPEFWSVGDFAYTKLNYVIRKDISVSFLGMKDVK